MNFETWRMLDDLFEQKPRESIYKMAVHINHKGARLPEPTSELILQIAMDARAAFHETMPDAVAYLRWDDLPERVQDSWKAAARASYFHIAKRGGGEITNIKAPKETS
jgi:hypothetical protein